MKTPNKSTLAELLKSACNERDRLALALNDVLADKVKWFRKGNQALGICRAASPCGGIVIQCVDHYSFVYQWEEWWPGVRNSGPSDGDGMYDLREIGMLAHSFILNEQAREWGQPKPATVSLAA